MMEEAILFHQDKHLGVITLNRPQALNALTLDMIKVLQKQLSDWEKNDAVHAVIIQASEGKAFCAGGDIRWLYEKGLAKSAEQMDFFWHEYRLNHDIHHYSKPYIALLDGITMGGGVGISLHGSHPIATERFSFAMPETGIGFFPDIGAAYLLSRCKHQAGLYIALTGQRLDAPLTQAVGLIRGVIASEQLPALKQALINTDLSTDAHSQVDVCLQNFYQTQSASYDFFTKMEHCFKDASIETILECLQDANDAWSTSQYQTLLQKSPLSLKVTFEQIKRAAHLSISDCLRMDYILASHFMRDHDFYEGVRALIVDKDKSPRWDPPTLDGVSNAKVNAYFEPDGQEITL